MAVSGSGSEVVESVSVGAAAPVPLSWTVCVPAPSVMVSVPDAGPDCVGEKATSISHALDAARELPHALAVMAKGPVAATVLMEMAAAPELVAVTESGDEVVPTSTAPKARDGGVSETAFEAAPVPLSGKAIWPP